MGSANRINGLVYNDSHLKFPTWFTTNKSELKDSRHHVTNSSMVSWSNYYYLGQLDFITTTENYHIDANSRQY